jgi:hypothetical protein
LKGEVGVAEAAAAVLTWALEASEGTNALEAGPTLAEATTGTLAAGATLADAIAAGTLADELFAGLGRAVGRTAGLVCTTGAADGEASTEDTAGTEARGAIAEELAAAELAGFDRTDTEGALVATAEALGTATGVSAAGVVVEGTTGGAVAPAVTVSVLVAAGIAPNANAIDVGSGGREPPAIAAEGLDTAVAVAEAGSAPVAETVTTTSAVGSPSAPITVEAPSLGATAELAAGTEAAEETPAGRVAVGRGA